MVRVIRRITNKVAAAQIVPESKGLMSGKVASLAATTTITLAMSAGAQLPLRTGARAGSALL
jgi:hypothetical protein